ncbi:Glucoamylase [Galdieria sulphuraria]|uniref:glucan 1,4-alpha-glucosidase n=1 Tax=Galdieria sulphuraria TaxID=130081 RepID=M2XJ88_GALSU|nr:alpha-glucosidase [Galdieria sulphuraria]EME30177.1 alpha-glucosidase [Galdieria sulphuraria]GJD11643.1 Glucoamylase [Galdieria sulphuraria]|eukprot:XP_005706697.1 alpha-glucosidase [Galdieria sulphuraria]
MKLIFYTLFLWVLVSYIVQAQPLPSPTEWQKELEEWIPKQYNRSVEGIFDNINRPGTAKGCIVAADSKKQPDYYYNWIRDAAITMQVVVTMYERATDPKEIDRLETIIKEYIAFNHKLQHTPNYNGNFYTGGLGAAHFLVNGSAYPGGWCTENDGPALRALAVIKFTYAYLQKGGNISYIRDHVFGPTNNTLTRADLDYIARVWPNENCGPWEELYGIHFFDQYLQRTALLRGVKLAKKLGYDDIAKHYQKSADDITQVLPSYIAKDFGIVLESVNTTHDTNHETFLDTSTILAIIHGYNHDDVFAPTNEYVIGTANMLRLVFQDIYPVNMRKEQSEGTLFGRFPDDIYDGYTSDVPGNPWILCTLGMAQYYYELAAEWLKHEKIVIGKWSKDFFKHLKVMPPGPPTPESTTTITGKAICSYVSALLEEGDRVLNAIRRHTIPSGMFTEEIDRYTGFEQGAINLTWSYDAFVTAVWSREDVHKYFSHYCEPPSPVSPSPPMMGPGPSP